MRLRLVEIVGQTPDIILANQSPSVWHVPGKETLCDVHSSSLNTHGITLVDERSDSLVHECL